MSALPVSAPHPPGLWLLFRIWLTIGAQSFGGGATTILLMRRTFLDRYNWLTEDEYTRFFALTNLSPGINIAAFVVLMGKRLHGTPGIAVSMAGMFLPSALITTLLTASYAALQDWKPMQAAMHGLVPAVVGLYFLIVVQYSLPVLRRSYRSGRGSFAFALAFVVGAVALAAVGVASSLTLVIGAVFGALLLAPKATVVA